MNCITESKSVSPDIRILRVAEHLAKEGFERLPNILRQIAGDVRSLMTDRNSSGVADSCRTLIETSDTEADLFDAWRDMAPSLPALAVEERLRIIEAMITRVCVVSMDDGR